jgi:hypothetical protein
MYVVSCGFIPHIHHGLVWAVGACSKTWKNSVELAARQRKKARPEYKTWAKSMTLAVSQIQFSTAVQRILLRNTEISARGPWAS